MEQYTIEEKVIERAYKKLALDALVIQQGRLAEQKSKHFSRLKIFLCDLFLGIGFCIKNYTLMHLSSLQLLIKMNYYRW